MTGPVAEPQSRPAAAGGPDVLGLLMLAFQGRELPAPFAARLRASPAAGVTLFRHFNVESPAQVRELTAALQRAAGSGVSGRRDGMAAPPPLLVAADQEGGQLQGLGDGLTPFAGNMALGAAGDEDLAERVARATGLELRAVGVNVSYSPCVDLATNPDNPAIGIRSFGDDPALVSRLAAATVRGLRSAGVAATAKHFPGLGDLAVDSHAALGVVRHDRARLDAVELPPFRAAFDAGADLVMSAHIGVPALTGDSSVPATLSRRVMHDLLRDSLGFRGLSITDALDMRAIPQGPAQAAAVVAALRAGVDLLLCAPDEEARQRIEAALLEAWASGGVDRGAVADSLARQRALRLRLAGFSQPDLDVVGSAGHLELARELARRSITLVRNEAGLLPLRLPADARVAAIMPRPRDLTPADTSSTVPPMLADALRARHPNVQSFVTGNPPSDAEIAELRAAAAAFDLLIVGTISASLDPQQARLVDALLDTEVPVVTVALRTPFDLAAFPAARTHLCTYGILRPSLDALADALWGVAPTTGRLTAPIPGLYPGGHGAA
ncbi:MAG: beta-N-acetylhexosaminidase [Chloroflexota bacterium]|nr:beta-N-acetylhexosaminidase [Chloroflexota bacterium]